MTLPQQLADRQDFQTDAVKLPLVDLYRRYGGGYSRGTIHRAWTALKNQSKGNGMHAEELVDGFFGDKPVDKPVDAVCNIALAKNTNTTLIPMDATPGEAQKLHKQAISQSRDLFETLREIHERKAYVHLNCGSFRDYMKRLKKEVEFLEISERAFFYRLAHREVTQILQDAGMDTRGLTQHHSAVLNKLPPGMIPEAVEMARQKAREYEPTGRAAEFYHPGKVLTSFVEQAVAERTAAFVQDTPDPFEGENDPAIEESVEGNATQPDFFVEARKRPIGEKPLPPREGATSPTNSVDRPLADFISLEYRPFAEVMFVAFRVAPGEEYEAWVPVSEIQQALGNNAI